MGRFIKHLAKNGKKTGAKIYDDYKTGFILKTAV